MSSSQLTIFRRFLSDEKSGLHLTCSVCLCSRSFQSFSTDYCCSTLKISHQQREICDSCVHQHVLSKLYSCLTNSICCPERECRQIFSSAIICDILLRFQSDLLLNDYLREQQWQGKSEEWIERFARRCPGCEIPIEKNGGCDEMICSKCQRHFYWSNIKALIQVNSRNSHQSFFLIHPLIDGILLVISLLCFILTSVIYFK